MMPILSVADCQTIDEAWGRDDHDGHGTEMAGIALLGDLTYPVGDHRKIALTHRLESVKLLPPDKFPLNEPANLGYVTQSAINLPEIEAPERKRVICMAVTNKGSQGHSQPVGVQRWIKRQPGHERRCRWYFAKADHDFGWQRAR